VATRPVRSDTKSTAEKLRGSAGLRPVLHIGEAPQVERLFLDHRGLADGNGVAARGCHLAVKGELGIEIPLERAAAP